jgi:Raf kinase inhibitor-like YbhB/YbcL family protein
MSSLLSRITISPEVCHGKQAIRGRRYPAESIPERWLVLFVALAAAGLVSCSRSSLNQTGEKGKTMQLKITSSAFTEGGMIPKQQAYDDRNASPPLAWGEPPAGTKSLALICDDPDAPVGTWVHWVLFNIPATTCELPASVAPEKTLGLGERQGKNDYGQIGYGGPCPPSGTHRYFFKLYALDTSLSLEAGATKAQLEQAMQGHILAQGQLMGRYKKS